MKELLGYLNRTPGVLGSAYVNGETAVCDIGDALGGSEALPLVRRTVEACGVWAAERPGEPLESAVFVGPGGRIVAWSAGSGTLVAFAETDAGAGVLRLRMREVADKIMSAEAATRPMEEGDDVTSAATVPVNH